MTGERQERMSRLAHDASRMDARVRALGTILTERRLIDAATLERVNFPGSGSSASIPAVPPRAEQDWRLL